MEEGEDSINFETFKIFMGDTSGAAGAGKRGGKKQSQSQKDQETMQLFKTFDKEGKGLVTIKNLKSV